MSNLVQIPRSVWGLDYQYFYMENEDGKNRISEEHLNQIQTNYDKISKQFNNSKSQSDYLSWIQNGIASQAMKCRQAEMEFVEQLKPEHQEFKMAYHKLTDKSGVAAIKLFTDYFTLGRLNGKDKTAELGTNKNQMNFKFVVSSKQFVDKMRSKGPEGGLHYFSRTSFAQAMGIKITKEGNTISESSRKKIKTTLFGQIRAGWGKSRFWQSIQKSFDQIKIDNVDLQPLFAQIKYDIKEQLVDDMAEDAYKGVIRDTLDLALDNAIKEGLVDEQQAMGGLEIEWNGVTFLKIAASSHTPGAVETKYQKLSEESREKAYKEGAKIFVDAIEEVLKNMQSDMSAPLNLMWASIDINEDKNFWNSVFNYYNNNKNTLIQIVNQILGRQNESWKRTMDNNINGILNGNKKAYGFVSGIIGIVGEFSAAIGYSSFSDIVAEANGAAKDELQIQYTDNRRIETKYFGNSFMDLILNKKYGVNIKYYISSSKAITLYGEQKDSKGYRIIGSDILFKYIDTKTLVLLKFLEANYEYLKTKMNYQINSDDLDEIYLNVSIANLSNFLRQTTTIPTENMNIFFQINNMIIPSSAIYNLIYNSIKQDLFKFQNPKKENLWFKIDRNGYYPYDSYKELNSSIINEHFINNLKNDDYKGAVIHFKGLKIRKEDLQKLI